MHSPGRDLAAGSDPQAAAEEEVWAVVSHCLLAGGGESRRPKAVCNPGNGAKAPGTERSINLAPERGDR